MAIKVLVSTDDKEIVTVGRRHCAEVSFRRTAATDDISSASLATYGALLQAEEHWQTRFDVSI